MCSHTSKTIMVSELFLVMYKVITVEMFVLWMNLLFCGSISLLWLNFLHFMAQFLRVAQFFCIWHFSWMNFSQFVDTFLSDEFLTFYGGTSRI
ncbi:hypothetical protein LDENG_00205650 [Lucifuga dentata]|nr:hypothetical protein LDENG_00205650 [Lucifuga dentata]